MTLQMRTGPVTIRATRPDDAEVVGRIIFEAFAGIAARHAFAPDFPSPDAAIGFAQAFVTDPTIFGVVAEVRGRIIGSNFLSEGDAIRGVGPITIDPEFQGKRVGRQLMQAVIERGRGADGIRLLQDGFNMRSLSLYTSLGFAVREPMLVLSGRPKSRRVPNALVRPMTVQDADACNRLYARAHGFSRAAALNSALRDDTPMVVERAGRITGYMAAPTNWAMNHATALSHADMQALLAGAAILLEAPLSFLLPTRDQAMLQWCLEQGMRAVKPMTLMSIGSYSEPKGVYMPSVLC